MASENWDEIQLRWREEVLYLKNGVFFLLLGAVPCGMFPGDLEAFGVSM